MKKKMLFSLVLKNPPDGDVHMMGPEKNPKIYVIMIDDQPYSTVHCKFKKEFFFILSKKSNNIPIQQIKCPHSNNSIPYQ